jgi:hypothetical protein
VARRQELVYDLIAVLKPVPAGVSREQALKLTLKRYNVGKKELAWRGELGRKPRGCASNGS